MKVMATKNFQHRGQLIETGTMLTIRDEDFPRIAHLVKPMTLEGMQQEYFRLLSRWWDPATDSLPDTEIQKMLARLDTLYQELHRQGRKVPVRLPVERNQGNQEKQGLAL